MCAELAGCPDLWHKGETGPVQALRWCWFSDEANLRVFMATSYSERQHWGRDVAGQSHSWPDLGDLGVSLPACTESCK